MIQTIVETYDGLTALKKDCRFIKGDFYIKNKQCFLIDGVWYRINSGFITFDYENQNWVIIKSAQNLIKGIIGFDNAKDEIILGYYTGNPYKNVNVILPNGSQYNCIDYRILPHNLFKEDKKNLCFVHHTQKTLTGIPNISFGNNAYPFPPPYCCKHYPENISDLFKKGTVNNLNSLTNIASYISHIGDYSFGFEFETNKGKIPNYRILESGLMPLRDGSIQGIEFATIPLNGKKGVNTLENACKLLQEYTTFTEQESLHLHVGNTPSSKKFVGYLYTIACILENEIYAMFPKYYAQTSKFKAKAKDYNMPLRKELVELTPEETFNSVAFYLSEGKKYQGFGAEHPSDPDGSHKWGINSRYHWVNLIPLMFGSNKTVEFRCHIPTNDPIKVINWLYICSAIIKYADRASRNNVDLVTLKNLTITDVLKDTYSSSYKLSSYLTDYVNKRKTNRKNDESMGDYTGGSEISCELHGKSLYNDIN